MKTQLFLQNMIDMVSNGKATNGTAFSGLNLDATAKRGFSKLLRWLFVQDYVGDNESTANDVSFSSKQVVDLVNTLPELQYYFQIKDGKLAFADKLDEREALEMIQYVKQNYRPRVNF